MSQSPTTRQERVRVSQACENCREKKSKCDGAKPVCGRCQLKSLECHYGMTKRVKNQQVMRELATKVAQYESILKKNIPAQQRQHHPGDEQGEKSITTSFLEGTSRASSFSGPASASTMPAITPIDPSFSDDFLPTSPTVTPQRHEEPTIQPEPTSNIGPNVWGQNPSDCMSLPPRSLLEQASKAFLQGSAILFTFFGDEEIPGLFNEVYGDAARLKVSTIALTQLCAMASVGCQYFPRKFNSASRLAFLSVVKLNLEECIESSPLAGMRIAVLLCMYFTFEKRTAALAYADMGLRLAKINRAETQFAESLSTPWQRVFGSLVFLDCWLCASTGHLPSLHNTELHSSIALMGTGRSSTTETIQFEMIKIAMLSSLILRDVCHARFVSAATINSYKNRLQQWLTALPEYMRLDYLLNIHESASYLRPIFLVHLLYMSTVILLYRRVVVELACFQRNASEIDIFRQTQEFLEPCLWTARQVAKLLEIALSQGQVLPKCWLYINATYSTCSALLYFAVNRLFHRDLSEELNKDFTAIQRCIEVLSYCAEIDETAKQYLKNTSKIYESAVQVHQVMISPNMNLQEDASSADETLQHLISMSTSYLIHPFDGGFRREVKFMEYTLVDRALEKANVSSTFMNQDDTDMLSPKSPQTSRQSSYIFLSDLGCKRSFMGESNNRSKGKEKEESTDSSTFNSMHTIVFGS